MIQQDLRGQIMLNAGIVNQAQLDKALQIQKETGHKIGAVLIEAGFVTEDEMLLALERQSGISWVKLRMSDVDADVMDMVSVDLVKMYKICPVKMDGDMLVIAISDPLSYDVLDDLRLAVQKEVNPILVSEDVLENCVAQFYKIPKSEFWSRFEFSELNQPVVEESDLPDEDEVAIESDVVLEETPLSEKIETIVPEKVAPKLDQKLGVSLLENLLRNPQSFAVSDIYMEPFDGGINLRFRRDGVVFSYDDPQLLQDAEMLWKSVFEWIGMPLPDEIMRTRIWKEKVDDSVIDLRGSVCASQYGFDVHLKRIHSYQVYQSLNQLGMSDDSQTQVQEFLKKKKGLMWVLGDANSGVSTTLRVLMDQADIKHKKIVSFESFIEEDIEGVNQYEIQPRDTSAIENVWQDMLQIHPDMIVIDSLHLSSLKSLLVESIVTGCLVVIGMNVKTFEHALFRLEDMGIARDFLIYETDYVLEQALVRSNCHRCIDVDENPIALKKEITGMHYKSIGCESCYQTGYQGRCAIFQVSTFDERMRQSLLTRHSSNSLEQLVSSQGGETLYHEGSRLLQERMTTREELNRLGLA